MSTLPNQIVDDAITLLNSPAPPAGVPNATRCFTFALDPSQLPSIAGYLNEIEIPDPAEAKGAVINDDVHFKFECRIAGTSSTAPDVLVDDLVKHVVSRLTGQEKGVNAGKLYRRILFNGVKYEYVQADHAYCLATIQFIARSQHKTGDLTAWA